MFDPEIEAIAKSHDLFKILDDDSKIRVIQWLISKFQLNPHPHSWAKQLNGNSLISESADVVSNKNNGEQIEASDFTAARVQEVGQTIESFDSVAEFFAETTPNSDWEKALVVATYLQIKNNLSDFNSYDINKELKNLGHYISEISHAFDVSISKKPQLILQMRKDGNSRQGRKKYKVSAEGIKYVKSLLQKQVNEAR